MILRKKDKDEIRKILKEDIEKLKVEKEKIKLPKDLLEQLIFDINQETGAKKIVWSGGFLQKLDLSEVSFNNVNWNSPYEINLSYTNIKIDFSKAHETSTIRNISLEGVDLSKSNLDVFNEIYNCNLKDTKVVLNLNDGKKRIICHSNLSGIDLSQSEISADTYYRCFSGSYLSGTGLHIKTNENTPIFTKESVGTKIKQGTLDNCYLNGKRIKTKEELLKLKEKKLLEYEEFKEEQKRILTKELKKYPSKK